MFKRNWKTIFLVFSQFFDLLAIGLSAWLVTLARKAEILGAISYDERLFRGLIIFIAVYFLVATVMGVYRGSFIQSIRLQLMRVTGTYICSLLVSLAFVALLRDPGIDRTALSIFCPALLLALFLDKTLLSALNIRLQRAGLGVQSALIVGDDENAARVLHRLSSFPRLGYRIEGFVVSEKNGVEELQPQYDCDELESLLKSRALDSIFIPSARLVVNGYARLINVCQRNQVKLKITSPRVERLLEVARMHDVAGITLTSPPRYRMHAAKQFLKRAFDILGASCLILLLSPMFLITALAIYFDDRGPVFFAQKRSAIRGGREFNFMKFRSMIANADGLRKEMQHHNESDGALFKIMNDPRITRVGRFIRKYSIDELPQLLNVIRGDMSLVGPRPLPVSDFEEANEPEDFWDAVKDRASVRPGMTGLWQVSGRSEIKFRDMVLLDLYYVENRSLSLDLEILFRTVAVVVFGKGSY